MNKGLHCLMSIVLLSGILGPNLPRSMVAAPSTPLESEVYTEDFSTYTAKNYTQATVWDIWAKNLRLGRLDAVYQVAPVVAVDGSGNAFVVWYDHRNGDSDIYAQRLDATGNRLWATDLRVNSDIGTASQHSPAVAVDRDGNAIVVWEDQRNGNDEIYAQRLDATGNRLWPTDLQVNSDSGTAYQFTYKPWQWIAMAMPFVAWRDDRNNNADIYAQWLDATGTQL